MMKKFNKFLFSIAFLAIVYVFPALSQEKATGLSNVKLFLDPGHSGRENMGANNYSEAEKVLRVAFALREYLLTYTDMRPENIMLCRESDLESVDLATRTDMANTWGADFYYSIHSDAAGPAADYSVFLYGGRRSSSGATPTEKSPEGGKEFGDILAPNLTFAMRSRYNPNYSSINANVNDLIFYGSSGTTPYLHVNRVSRMASLLSEAGFHTNPAQNQLNMNAEWKKLQAYSAYQSLVKFLSKKYGAGQVNPVHIGIATGIIRDNETNNPINGAVVTVKEGENVKTYTTDTWESLFNRYSTKPNVVNANDPGELRNGFYWIEGFTPGATVTVKVEAPGYVGDEKQIVIPETIGEQTRDGLGIADFTLLNTKPAVILNTQYVANESGLIIATPITFTFSRKMDRTTVEQAINVVPEGALSFRWTSDYILNVDISQLNYDAEYTLKVDGQKAKNSQAGAVMFLDGDSDGVEGGDFMMDFVTQESAPPAILSYDPQGDQEMTVRPVVRIEFDKPVKESSILPDHITVTDAVGNLVAGKQSYRVMGHKSVMHFIFNSDLNAGEFYTVKLKAGLEDVTVGKRMDEEFVYTFLVRPREVTARTMIHQFNPFPAGLSIGTNADQCTGFNTDITRITQDANVPVSSHSMRFDYSWITTDGRLRINDGTANASMRSFRINQNGYVQFYLYGDGSNSLFELVLQRQSVSPNTFYGLPIVVDWVGWKLITQNLRTTPLEYPWLGGEGRMPENEAMVLKSLRWRAPLNKDDCFLNLPLTVWLAEVHAVQLVEPEKFTVNFDSQGAGNIAPVIVSWGDKLTRPADPADGLAGHLVAGWYVDRNFTHQWNFDNDRVFDNTTLFAKWEPLIVSYDPQDAQEVSARPIVRIEFREPLDAETIVPEQIIVKDTDSNFPDGEISYMTVNGKGVLHYLFNVDLTENVVYTVTLTAGYKTLKGITVEDDFEFTFTPRKRTKTVNLVLNDFNATVGDWQVPILSGPIPSYTHAAITIDSDVLATTNNTGSMRIDYQWDKDYNEAAPAMFHLIYAAETPKFSKDNIIQYYLFGDGSNAQFSLGLRAGDKGPIWTNLPFVVDWVGWKLITLDLSNDLVLNDDILPEGEVLNLYVFYVKPVAPADRSYEPSAMWVSQLQLVTLGDLEDAFTVSFDTQGGNEVHWKIATDGGLLMSPIDPVRRGYTFDGWFLEPTCVTEWNFDADIVTADLTLFAGWNPVAEYTVTFYPENGEATIPVIYYEGETIIRPDDPVFEGNVFDCWITGEGQPWNFLVNIVTADLALYAKWKSFHTVTFNSTGGSLIDDAIVFDGEKVTQPDNPTRDNYSFDGWFTDIACTTAWSFATGVTKDITLYAKWIPFRVVTFDPNNEGATFTDRVPEGGKVTKPTDPVFAGHRFDGWYVEKGCREIWRLSNTGGAANVRDNPGTTGTNVMFQFNLQDVGRIMFVEEINNTVQPGTPWVKFYIDEPSRGNEYGAYAGYVWMSSTLIVKVSDGAWNFATDAVTKDTTLYAKWTAIFCTVTFDSQDGAEVALEELPWDHKVTKPADPTREGFDFGGWFREAACVNAWNFDTDVVTADITLYAKWTTVFCTVTFDSQGGTEVAPEKLLPDHKVTKPADPTREGFDFGGWFREAACVSAWNFDTDVVTADITLYAKWTAIPVFTVIFNVPGGGMNSISVTHGNKIPKPSDPIREHYTFEGWFKDENCTQAWDFANDVVTEDITLFSKWSLKNYTVTFNSRGGSNVPVATVAYGAKVAKPSPDPTRANYAFKGWFKDADGTTEWNFDNDVVSGNITLWAKWENVTGNESVEVRYSKVYPNPTDGVLTIEFAAPGTYIVSITDITGRVLLQETLTGQMERMDISSLPSGSYLLVVVDDNKQQTVMKVVKQ